MKSKKNIGIEVKAPEKECTDRKCPFHGETVPKAGTFTGIVLAKDTHNTATIERSYPVSVQKYERSETRRTKMHVHNPPCIDASIGDIVRVAKTRPLSKTKNFVIIENLGKKKGFIEELGAREEAKVKEKPEEKETEEEKAAKPEEPENETQEKEQERPKEVEE